LTRLALLALLLAPPALRATGTRADYFSGKLLTTGDLSGDQAYLQGAGRQLGDPAQVLGDASLSLDDLFAADGRGRVRLSFDCAIVDCAVFSEPLSVVDPHRDDMVFLDLDSGRWFGEPYLSGVAGLGTGVYRSLSGRFDRLESVPEPSSPLLVGAGLLVLLATTRRRSRVQGPSTTFGFRAAASPADGMLRLRRVRLPATSDTSIRPFSLALGAHAIDDRRCRLERARPRRSAVTRNRPRCTAGRSSARPASSRTLQPASAPSCPGSSRTSSTPLSS
jgi:hypothetical protein